MKAPAVLEQKIAFVAIREYAAHSYLYYDKDESIISDGQYDDLCKWLHENFSWLKPYDINNYLRGGLLRCGSGYDIKVVGLTRDYAEFLLADHKEKQEDPFS